jgi:hypothetical protein
VGIKFPRQNDCNATEKSSRGSECLRNRIATQLMTLAAKSSAHDQTTNKQLGSLLGTTGGNSHTGTTSLASRVADLKSFLQHSRHSNSNPKPYANHIFVGVPLMTFATEVPRDKANFGIATRAIL